jgi:hypothetical protein
LALKVDKHKVCVKVAFKAACRFGQASLIRHMVDQKMIDAKSQKGL